MREPNILLDGIIDEAGTSHGGLAARVNRLGDRDGLGLLYDHASVRRWIRDGTIPRGRAPELICEVLSRRLGRTVMLADIGMDLGAGGHGAGSPLAQVVDHAAALWRSDAKQAAALRAAEPVRVPAAIVPVFEWENPPDDLDVARHGPRRVDAAQVRSLAAARTRYERMYRQAGGIPVRPRVVAFLNDQAAPLLKSGYDDATGRQLHRTVGSLTALAGICAYDADLQAVAQRYFFHALRMAKASGDRGFGGYVVALLANQSLYLGLYRQVIQYAETALRAARQHLTPALVTDLSTLQAKAYARMGDRPGCHASMRRSEETAARIRFDEEPPETGYVQPGLVEVQHADALRRLGDLTAARSYAERSVAAADRSHLRGQVHRLATLAMILASQGNADAAAGIAGQMLDKAAGMESCRITDRMTAVRDAVTAVSDGAVARQLSERVDDVLGVPM
jgi:tetratricopeptide (TPR) repeat protein